jgi:hypothetical protein
VKGCSRGIACSLIVSREVRTSTRDSPSAALYNRRQWLCPDFAINVTATTKQIDDVCAQQNVHLHWLLILTPKIQNQVQKSKVRHTT